jgi:exosome complex component RRP41
MPKLEEVTLLQMDGILSTKETEQAINMAIEGCKQVYEIQREALKKKYGMVDAESDAEEEPSEEAEEEAEAKEE